MKRSRPSRRGRRHHRAQARRRAASVPDRVPARPRAHNPLARVQKARIQDPGIHQPRGRPLPNAPDAHDRGRPDRPHHSQGAQAQRGPRRGHSSGPRPRTHAVRACGRKGAERAHGRTGRIRAQHAEPARGRRPRKKLRGLRRLNLTWETRRGSSSIRPITTIHNRRFRPRARTARPRGPDHRPGRDDSLTTTTTWTTAFPRDRSTSAR